MRKLRWLDTYLGNLMLDDITLNVIDRIKTERLKVAGKLTVNRYLAVVGEWIDRFSGLLF